jgi:hypothetical protein
MCHLASVRGILMVSSDGSTQALPNSNRTPGIVVYTSNGCHKCSTLKEWFKAANRYFEERSLENVDVMTDLVMRNVVVLSAPVIEVDKAIYTEDQFFDGNSLSVNRLLGILEGQ